MLLSESATPYIQQFYHKIDHTTMHNNQLNILRFHLLLHFNREISHFTNNSV